MADLVQQILRRNAVVDISVAFGKPHCIWRDLMLPELRLSFGHTLSRVTAEGAWLIRWC